MDKMVKENKMTNKEKQKLAEKNKDIPTEVIEKDIYDTQIEIIKMEAESKRLAGIPLSSPTARWDHMRAEARKTGIQERKEFIKKLQAILEVRNPAKEVNL